MKLSEIVTLKQNRTDIASTSKHYRIYVYTIFSRNNCHFIEPANAAPLIAICAFIRPQSRQRFPANERDALIFNLI